MRRLIAPGIGPSGNSLGMATPGGTSNSSHALPSSVSDDDSTMTRSRAPRRPSRFTLDSAAHRPGTTSSVTGVERARFPAPPWAQV